ncbi:MAG: 4Fe-4S binding protein [Elusimicrobiota bacterium]
MKHTVFTFLFSAKYLVFLVLAGAGVLLLTLRKSGKGSRAAVLAAAFLLLGGVAGLVFPVLARPLGLHPSPMCAVTKLIGVVWLRGFFPPPMVAALIAIVLLSLAGKKLFCGWACPLGAAQELLYLIPGIKKLKNIPFRITNSVRAVLMGVFLAALFAFGIITYDYFNGFEALHWQASLSAGAVALVIAAASLFYYRPYCYLVCPIGLLSWALERFSLLQVRLDKEACSDCKACLDAAPCPSLAPLMEGKTGWLPDCTSCGLCLKECPTEALRFGPPKPSSAYN